MLRNLKVGTKLLVVLAAPALVIVVLVTIGVRDRLDVSRSAERVEQVAQFASVDAALVQALQQESLWSATLVATDGAAGRDELDAARDVTDEAMVRYEASLADVEPASESQAVAEAVRLAESRVDALRTVRTSVDIGQVQPFAVGDSYAETIDALVGVNASLVQSANDPELLRGLATMASLERISEAQGVLATQIVAAARVGTFTDRAGDACLTFGPECESYARAEQAQQDLAQANRAFGEGSATPEERQLEQDARVAGAEFDELAEDALVQATAGGVLQISAPDATAAAIERLDALAAVDTAVTTAVVDAARELGDRASAAVLLYLLGGVGALAVALAVAVAVTRSVTRPLDRLTTAAYRLSTEQLPALVEQLRDPDEEEEGSLGETFQTIPVDSRDEIGQLAEAFNTIQTVTVDVAEEQSRLLRKGIGDIFVHLARRNQSLLDRQIEFIDHLERNEADPDQLDNLFKLDHLATRMRRNAESLLVLAGAEPPRRRGRPVPVADVVRVAIGEVEDFARIELAELDEATVAGNVAVDLAHMLSELMENATHFSPPETAVVVQGRRDDRSGYLITVTDRGIGMNAEQLVEANEQLAHPPLVGLTLSRSLGFIVVGRLAARFGLTVTVERTADGGTMASVQLPYSTVEYADDDRRATDGPDDELAMGDLPPIDVTAAVAPVEEPTVATAPSPPAPPMPVAPPEPASTPAPAAEHGGPAELPSRPPSPAPATGPGGLPSRRTPTEVAPATAPSPAPHRHPDEEELPTRSGDGATPSLPSRIAASDVSAPTSPPERRTQSSSIPDDELTPAGLVRRTPKAATRTAVDPLEAAAVTPGRAVTRTTRSPDEVRRMLSRYRSGLDRGRHRTDPGARPDDTPTDRPDDRP